MMHPGLILLIGVLSEVFVQFGKRAVYWIDPSATSIHYALLLAGDLVFLGLFSVMLSNLKFQRRHYVVLNIFLIYLIYTSVISSLVAAILAVRNTYLWVLFTIFFAMSVKNPIKGIATRSLVDVVQLLSIVLIVIAVIQVQTDFAFEKPWFEFSGTSLNYGGVTNFGQAAKAFSLFSGPTDFAIFGLLALAIGIGSRVWILALLGVGIIVISGTRGILLAIPVWLMITWLSVKNIRRNYFLSILIFFGCIFIFSNELINFLYAIPNSRFSPATLAPRIQLWLNLDAANFLTGGGFAANLALDNLTAPPNVIDSGIIYFLSEIGAPLTLGLIYVLLGAAKSDLLGPRRGPLQLFIGVLLIASIAQIPFHTRLSNFVICLLIYSDIFYVKNIHIYRR
jgi:type IV secretory pathway TrbD component